MKMAFSFLLSVFIVSLARAQATEPTVSTSRSARLRINTEPIYEAVRTTVSNSPKASVSSGDKALSSVQAIHFVQSKAEFMPDAQPALEQLVAYMRDKPTAEIELSGHTDNQGDFDQNVLLSKQRVDLVKAYMVRNGIAASRITTRGYGPTRPIASNQTEATRQLNRRVEVRVTK